MRIDVTLAGLIFWFVFGLFAVLGDTGLYMTVWHRSLLADAQRQANFNRRYTALAPYTALSDLLAHEQDTIAQERGTDDSAIETLDRQQPHDYGRSYFHLDGNYRGCEDLRKIVRLANTAENVNAMVQQTLADQTLNFVRCITTTRLSLNA